MNKIQSVVTGKMYNPKDCVYIINTLQTYKYIENNAELLDLVCGYNNKLVYVFDKKRSSFQMIT